MFKQKQIFVRKQQVKRAGSKPQMVRKTRSSRHSTILLFSIRHSDLHLCLFVCTKFMSVSRQLPVEIVYFSMATDGAQRSK